MPGGTQMTGNTAPLFARRLHVGAEVRSGNGVHFRVWAPRCRDVDVVIESGPGKGGIIPLEREGNAGYFSGTCEDARDGTRYRFRLDSAGLYPDPASRFQPDGPHGPSRVVDPGLFRWTDREWNGVGARGQVIYEMHIGTFTHAGTWAAAAEVLPELRDLGVTMLEIMPVADFPGRFGWGYDGVNLFAPCRLYGAPDDFRRFVDRAHAEGVGVILDVVYNHLGPDGNHMMRFAENYLTARHVTDWGTAINFDGPDSGPVREYYLANAGYWIDEYHLDGLRLDATQNIYDDSGTHIIAAVRNRVREAAGMRGTLVIAENESQDVRLVRAPEDGGYGLDGMWNDDFHHSASVRLTGYNEAYYTDYLGGSQEFVSLLKRGFLYQGQWYSWQKKRRGTPTWGIPPHTFIHYIQNHDQVANSGHGLRIHALTGPGDFRAMTALLLLGPQTPMLFQGQEFAASAPFLYFADHTEDLARPVREGRVEFLMQFRSLTQPEIRSRIPDPNDPETFVRCKLDHGERDSHTGAYRLHRDLLTLRREDPVFSAQGAHGLDGAVLGGDAFVLRFFGEDGDRLLVVNFGVSLHFDPAPEPLLAPPEEMVWEILWSSEHPDYGGTGTAPLDTRRNWIIPGHAAVALIPKPKRDIRHEPNSTRNAVEQPERA